MIQKLINILLILLTMAFSHSAFAVSQARYVQILIDTGQGGIYDGALSIAEIEIYDAAGVNLSLSASAAATSYSSTRYPSKAIDGNYTTIYSTDEMSGLNPNGSQYIIIDLGTLKTISSIKVVTSTLYNTASITGYRILTSSDNTTYQSVAVVSNASPTARTDAHSLSPTNSNVISVETFMVYLNIFIALYILVVLTGALWIIFS